MTGCFRPGSPGGLLFNPERAADPWAVAGAFAVLFLPYSIVGPFAGALLDRWDRRAVLVVANFARLILVLGVAVLLAVGASDLTVLCGALIVNGFSRFVTSGLSAALPHVVPREKVVVMNSVATATGGATATFLGANFMLLPRWLFGSGDTGAATIMLLVAVPIAVAFVLSLRFPHHVLGPDDTARACTARCSTPSPPAGSMAPAPYSRHPRSPRRCPDSPVNGWCSASIRC